MKVLLLSLAINAALAFVPFNVIDDMGNVVIRTSAAKIAWNIVKSEIGRLRS